MKRGARKPAKPHARKKAERRVLSLDELWANDVRSLVVADAHPAQRAAILDPADLISILCGRGAGKTTTLRARALIKLTSIRRARIVYIAITRDHAEELMWEPLKASIEFYGLTDEFTFNETKLRCTCIRTGATFRLVGMDKKKEIEKLRGQPFDEVQIDEGASHSPELLANLLDRIVGPRIGERNGAIVLAGTPGHILRGPFYDATRNGSTLHRPYRDRDKPEYEDWDKWSSHAWSLADVVQLPKAKERYPALVALWAKALKEKKRKGWSDDNPIWMREYLGRWAADDTDMIFRYRPHLVEVVDGKETAKAWNQWEPARAGPLHLAVLPTDRKDWHSVIALDKGYADEFAINALCFSPTDPDKRILHVYCFERIQMYAKLVAELLLGEKLDHMKPAGLIGALGGWPDGMVADADDAFLAELANVYGIKIKKAERKAEYKHGAIELVNGDLVDGRIKILKDSALEVQLGELQWKEDDFGRRKEDKAQANHSTDCLIYGRRLISELFETGAVAHEDAPSPASYVDPMGLGDGAHSEHDEYQGFLTSPDYSDLGE